MIYEILNGQRLKWFRFYSLFIEYVMLCQLEGDNEKCNAIEHLLPTLCV